MESNTLELLETYIEMIEKQDEMISKLGRLLNSNIMELKHLKNINDFFDERNQENIY